MVDNIWYRLDTAGRFALPFILGFIGVFLGAMVWPLPYLDAVAPPLALMAVYYWSIHRPDLFTPGMAFALGLLQDVIHDMPLGLTALLFVVTHQVVFHFRRFFVGHSFFMLWTGFALTAAGFFTLEGVLLDLIHWQILPALPVLTQAILAMIVFPLPCWLFIALQRFTANAESYNGR